MSLVLILDVIGSNHKSVEVKHISIYFFYTCMMVSYNKLYLSTEYFIFCNKNNTFEATDAAHSSKYSGLHFNIPHSGLISFPQILQFFLMREGTESSVKSALT